MEYCSKDDEMAVTFDGRFDFSSANHWKIMKAKEALTTMPEENGK